MRIRKRLAPAISDLRLQLRSSPSDPPTQPPDQSTNIAGINNKSWVSSVHHTTHDKINQKEFVDDERWIMEGNKNTATDDIREIVNICNGDELDVRNTIMHPSSSSAHQEENNKVVPLKKRKGVFERSPNEETISSEQMKSKTNKKCDDHNNTQDDQSSIMVDENETNIISSSTKKKIKKGSVIMEGSRCSRMNGRGWRCHQPTLVGYSLCEHHLGKGRLRSTSIVRHGNGGGAPPPEEKRLMVTKKRTKVGVVKARSMSSLLSQNLC
ncbi:hypothetical protein CASFOL_025408 [Castilleja foliolosa]|uniref:WRC domain-containing protein n=1 Tax=Castilleja foliolosa TaxID=1961234 RepID=A0ABD3CTB8_9LAMI